MMALVRGAMCAALTLLTIVSGCVGTLMSQPLFKRPKQAGGSVQTPAPNKASISLRGTSISLSGQSTTAECVLALRQLCVCSADITDNCACMMAPVRGAVCAALTLLTIVSGCAVPLMSKPLFKRPKQAGDSVQTPAQNKASISLTGTNSSLSGQ